MSTNEEYLDITIKPGTVSKLKIPVSFKLRVNPAVQVHKILLVLKKKLYLEPDRILYLYSGRKLLKPN